ncbi:sphingosine 1-phosphate receptor 4 [Erpetoichthys calabaricus]|uniref:Sphingosine-1-phosphate receptor 4 n=1 Tax=Erpetoichthys calabaricus TaxID=27687 RepID=A0A8C4SWQ7_ERPCA|nr:sphingosine 1-phosphate receptor 4 [Erpetoichthys calabaricus]XP_028672149.1 sphingosine 1-phosphate receptor 4 [Erpetoichthys calabaricus]XP_028672150.1 sphingosine 1-phosphate receptor 4 [Erpetoichthys calabaricus]
MDISTCLNLYSSNNANIIIDHYNFTGKLERRRLQENGISWAKIGFAILSFCIILENIVVLTAILRHIRFRSWVYVCIVNITLSDLLAGVAFIVNLCLSGQITFQLSPSLWIFREGVLFVTLAASIFSLLLTAVERYTTMMQAMPYKSTGKTYRIYILIVLSWSIAVVIGLLPLMGWNCICNLQDCSTLLPLYSKKYILFCVIMFTIILIVIWLLYLSIYRRVVSSTMNSNIPVRSQRKSMRLLKTVILILGAFFLCWGFLFVLLVMDFFCGPKQCKLLYSMDWAIALAILNSAINPIIYACGSMEVRKAIISIVCCCCFRVGLCEPSVFLGAEPVTSSESSLRESFRHSFRRVISPQMRHDRKMKKTRLNSTTSCLSMSSG